MSVDLMKPEAESSAKRREVERDTGSLQAGEIGETRFPVSLLGNARLRGQGNGAAHTAALRQAQQTQGNRAVQRAVHPAKSVQRFQRPDDEYNNKILQDKGGALLNSAEALPGWGNALSAVAAVGSGLWYGIDKATGNDKEADDDVTIMEQQALHALPWLGNMMAAGDAGKDYAAYQEDKNGTGLPMDTAETMFQNQTHTQFTKTIEDAQQVVESLIR